MNRTDNMVLFYHKSTPQTLLRKYCCSEMICVDSVKPEMLRGRREQAILFALPNDQISAATQMCRQTNCSDVCVIALDSGFVCEPIPADVSKPRLNYLETELTRRCNLHCRGCADFIQFAGQEKPFYDLQTFVRDLEQLKEFFWGIEKIRLMGGEPLLLKNIAEYAENVRRLFPDADLRIVTNGLLIPSLSSDALFRLKECGCSFDVTSYPPTERRKKEIVAALRSANVVYHYGVPIRFFFKNVSEKPSGDQKSAFENCMFPHCHMLSEGGILTPCSFAYCIRRFNRHFGTDYPETDFVDLYNTELDGWQIMEWLSNPHLFCGCCTSGMVPIRWRDGVLAEQSVEEDWIIPKNIWTDRFIPFAQRMVLPAAKKMRQIVQRNKNT